LTKFYFWGILLFDPGGEAVPVEKGAGMFQLALDILLVGGVLILFLRIVTWYRTRSASRANDTTNKP
jgi:hypothetical protein